MIKYYMKRDCGGCAAVREDFEELAIAHKTFMPDSSKELPAELANAGPLPVMVDEHEVIQRNK